MSKIRLQIYNYFPDFQKQIHTNHKNHTKITVQTFSGDSGIRRNDGTPHH